MLLAAVSLSESVNAFQGSCSVCCGEDQIISIVLKKLKVAEDSTTDFALNLLLAAAQAEQNLEEGKSLSASKKIMKLALSS